MVFIFPALALVLVLLFAVTSKFQKGTCAA